MSTNDAVFYRRNKQIQDAIDGQNLKQALQLIDKRIKKGEDTRFLKVSTCEAISIDTFWILSSKYPWYYACSWGYNHT